MVTIKKPKPNAAPHLSPLVGATTTNHPTNLSNAKSDTTSRQRPNRSQSVVEVVIDLEANPVKKGRRKKKTIDTEEASKTDEIKEKKGRYRPLLTSTYNLGHIIRAHSRNVDFGATDDEVDVWACEFQPQSTHVATCGGNTICLIDAAQGRVIRKYTHLEVGEEFYCLSWTTVAGENPGAGAVEPSDANKSDSDDGGELNTNSRADDRAKPVQDQECDILAVAGRIGSVKLLNPLQNECYRYLFGHTKPVVRVTFSKTRRRWLFSLSLDRTVRLWDIGTTNAKDDQGGSVCLAVFPLQIFPSPPSAFCLSHDDNSFMVGFQDGTMARFDVGDIMRESLVSEPAKRRRPRKAEKIGKRVGKEAEQLQPIVVYPVGVEWHESNVDDIAVIGDGFIVSRAAQDQEIMVWDPRTSTPTDAAIRCLLHWPICDTFCLKFRVVEGEGERVLVAGDCEGKIRIYNVGDLRHSQTLPNESKEMFDPDKAERGWNFALDIASDKWFSLPLDSGPRAIE
ncbi:hypothetical protein BC936DRAFT_147575 [Jimgerdemannia flammicorona]|uniref:Leucine-rich repeat and WD repeat-containing protein 1 WD domain-containing protein n=1 Tax=Jimgerdemannia flammicorona TaxID=994334 RepID=A0A433DN71_9FUNG|nr:hypothetical protein BC936DRAFT_147575 [Jimgerdemannia flammicorona]